MDPHQKQLSTMDPKLKAAYEQVMKPHTPTTIPSGSPEKKTTIPTPSIASSTVPKVEIAEHPAEATKEAEKPHITATFTPPAEKPASGGTIHIGYAKKPTQKFVLEKKKANIPPALYVVGCLIFFVVYTLFWMKIFNIPIPFLP